MFKTKKAKGEATALALIMLLFLAMMFLASGSTSPLFYFFGTDSSIFSLLGKGIREGKTLYTDLFDHKGPVIFIINALGHCLGGRSGLFFLQCVSGLFSVYTLFLIVKMLRAGRSSSFFWDALIIFAAAFAVFFLSFECGNLTEEYSLPFISAPLYLFIKYALCAEERVKHPLSYAFVYGISFSVLAFIRLNNAVTVAAGILAIGIWLVYKREIRNLLLNILSGMLGILTVAIPLCIYFYEISALDEMIYATFLYNFQIIGESSHLSIFAKPGLFAALYLPMLSCLVLEVETLMKHRRLELCDIIIAAILAFNSLSLWIANRFPHYFTVFIPVYIVFLGRYFRLDLKKLALYFVFFATLLDLNYSAKHCVSLLYDRFVSGESESEYYAVRQDMALIPAEERDSVIGFNIPAAYYLHGDILPCYRYYTLQESWASINPAILTDTLNWLRNDTPLWLIVPIGEDNAELLELLNEKYSPKQENEYIEFYRLK